MTVYQEAPLWFILLMDQCYRQLMPLVVAIPVEKTLPRGLVEDRLMNTAPYMLLVEGFRYQSLAISVLIVISRCLCTSQKEELPIVCGTGAASMSLYPDQHHTRRMRHPYRRLAAVQIEVNRFRTGLHICQ